MDDATWTMEVQHAEVTTCCCPFRLVTLSAKMQKLVGDLMRDKALLVKEKRNGLTARAQPLFAC